MALTSIVTKEQFNAFHRIDRVLYNILVLGLWREPSKSMQVMALCLWLEQVGFGYIVEKMSYLPFTLINELADEAIMWLSCINNNIVSILPENMEVPMLQILLENDISLQFFLQNQLKAIQGIPQVMTEVCQRALSKITQQAIIWNEAQSIVGGQRSASTVGVQSISTIQSEPVLPVEKEL
ncbi:uncharacterized protein [Rutidosis leptorrhynchoides]|uniref:uncharacterized protein n=1 Tax=Rutidosis leptorrhynchoides TaxID=125765 RepID=UPI003A999BD0